jgi:hypothetical protein
VRIAAAAAAVVAGALVLAVLLLRDDEDDEPGFSPRFTTGSGTEISLDGEAATWCGPFTNANGEELPAETLYVFQGDSEGEDAAAWMVRAVVDSIRVGRTYRLPSPYGDDIANPDGFVLFVGVRNRGIEASSTSERSRGTMTFEKVTCEDGGEVAFRISGTIGSEFLDGEPVRARGSFRDVVGSRPEDLREGVP